MEKIKLDVAESQSTKVAKESFYVVYVADFPGLTEIVIDLTEAEELAIKLGQKYGKQSWVLSPMVGFETRGVLFVDEYEL